MSHSPDSTSAYTAVPLFECGPHRLADDTFLIPTFAPGPAGTSVGVHSMLIRGKQPVIVDTGSVIARASWFDHVTSLVDLDDVRWVFLSHDDHDHVGNVAEVLQRCPNATLVASFLIASRAGADLGLPFERMRWLDAGDSFDVGDRRLRLVRPPMFDSPATRGLLDEATGVMWAVDSFGNLTQGAQFERSEPDSDLYDMSFGMLNGWNTPWIEWVDPVRYENHLRQSWSLHPDVIASAHGSVLRGRREIDEAFGRTLAMAAQPVPPTPGDADREAIIAKALTPTDASELVGVA